MARPHVLVVGGGFGGLEVAFALRYLLKDRVQMTLVSDSPHFLFKPNTIYIPFGMEPERLLIGLERPLRRRDIAFLRARVTEVHPERRTVVANGNTIRYDFLVIATGAGMRPEAVPGLREYAYSIWTPQDMLRLRQAFQELLRTARSGKSVKVLFLVPPNNKCSGPLYEIVFMLDTYLRRQGVRERVQLTYTTFEGSFIQSFGPRLHEVVTREFERRGIVGHTQYVVKAVRPGQVEYESGKEEPYDLLIAFPPYEAGVRFVGLPSDERGFLLTEPRTRQVRGYPMIYVVGDAGDFPVKQAFLAFLQADTVAEHLALQVAGKNAFRGFEPVSMCIMEMLDTATFAQVPLVLDSPVAQVRPGAGELYRVGVSPLWRLGKKFLGKYLPFRFGAGNPFHMGLPWRTIEKGMKLMSSLLAR
ncbi:MAG: FAD-dependent oxidoreductase [Candidatus Kapabacteria bacterium]|nr:FAD-dependent oxidoreductase [Candidatus Kapabacteria bacterium]MDW8224886.1 FAD-dependent oxidoreductase [Bacteroidota bacterium]